MHCNSDCSVSKVLEMALYPSQNYCLLFFPNCITLVGLSFTEISKGEWECLDPYTLEELFQGANRGFFCRFGLDGTDL